MKLHSSHLSPTPPGNKIKCFQFIWSNTHATPKINWTCYKQNHMLHQTPGCSAYNILELVFTNILRLFLQHFISFFGDVGLKRDLNLRLHVSFFQKKITFHFKYDEPKKILSWATQSIGPALEATYISLYISSMKLTVISKKWMTFGQKRLKTKNKMLSINSRSSFTSILWFPKKINVTPKV